jgi:hypothetical protein
VAGATVTAVGRGERHAPTKPVRDRIRLLAGLGAEGDAHLGRTVQHRSRVARDPTAPNLRQVHLLPAAPATRSPSGCRRRRTSRSTGF